MDWLNAQTELQSNFWLLLTRNLHSCRDYQKQNWQKLRLACHPNQWDGERMGTHERLGMKDNPGVSRCAESQLKYQKIPKYKGHCVKDGTNGIILHNKQGQDLCILRFQTCEKRRNNFQRNPYWNWNSFSSHLRKNQVYWTVAIPEPLSSGKTATVYEFQNEYFVVPEYLLVKGQDTDSLQESVCSKTISKELAL